MMIWSEGSVFLGGSTNALRKYECAHWPRRKNDVRCSTAPACFGVIWFDVTHQLDEGSGREGGKKCNASGIRAEIGRQPQHK